MQNKEEKIKVVIELDEINDDNYVEIYGRMAEVARVLIENGYWPELSISSKTYQWFLDNRREGLRLPKTLFGYPFRVRQEG